MRGLTGTLCYYQFIVWHCVTEGLKTIITGFKYMYMYHQTKCLVVSRDIGYFGLVIRVFFKF